MVSLIHFILEVVVLPIVDLFVLYNGNVVRWIAGGVFYVGCLIFAILAAVFLTMGIWPLGLIAAILAVIFLIMDFRNLKDRRERRLGNADVRATDIYEEERLQGKASEIRSGINNKF